MLIFPVRGPHLESTRGNGSGRAGLPVSGPMPSSAHKLAQQIFPAFCAGARWAWGHQVPSFARRSGDIPPRQEEGASSAEQPSSLSLSPSSSSHGFSLLAWPGSGRDRSSTSYLIEAFFLPSHTVLILIIGPFCFFPNYIYPH